MITDPGDGPRLGDRPDPAAPRTTGTGGQIPAQLVWMGVIVALAIAVGAVIIAIDDRNKANSINLQ